MADDRSSRVARQRYGALLIVTILSLAVQGVVAPGKVEDVVVAALAAAGLVLAFRAAHMRRQVQKVAGVLAGIVVLTAVARALGAGVGDGAARLLNASLFLLGPPAIALGIVRDLRTSRQVQIQTVMGVLAFYMLIGMLFGMVYGAIDKLGGDPFFANGQSATVSHCLYFSFTTLTTVGYGDFVARSDLGHTLAIFQALLGQIYLVTVVSLIVSNLGRPAPRD
jgi:hypothetical protein